jgi:hypothetical protein
MNTDTLDRDAYRRWWETEGRADLTTCPCGELSDDLTLDTPGSIAPPRTLITSRPGFCPRHTNMRVNREEFAAAILSGRFNERDLTDAEHEQALRHAEGKRQFDA